jgi:hypothetical protein
MQTHKTRRLRRVKLLGIFLLTLAGAISAYFFVYKPLYLRYVKLENMLGTDIPDAASEIKYSSWSYSVYGGSGEGFYIRFNLPPVQLDNFISKTCFKDYPLSEEFTKTSPYRDMLSIDWWKIPENETVIGSQCGLDMAQNTLEFEWRGAYSHKILVDRDDPKSYTVYLSIAISA